MPARIQRPIVILCLLCMNPAALRADEFTDFRIPRNQYLQWTGGAFGSSSWGRSAEGPNHRAGGNLQGTLQSALAFWRESDSRSMSVLANIDSRGFRYHSKDQRYYINSGPPLEVSSEEQSQRELSEGIGLATTQRWYPGGGSWNLAADLRGSLNDEQWWGNDQFSLQMPLSSVELIEVRSNSVKSYRTYFSGNIGTGLGRVRNATGVYEARVLEDRLRASGALSRALGHEARQRLAALMYARSDFLASTDFPALPVWDAIERILQEDGALSTALSAKDLFRLTEPYIGNSRGIAPDGLPRSPIVRAIGWNIGMALSGQTSRESRWYANAWTSFQIDSGVPQPPSESRSGGQSRNSSDALLAAFSAEYHRPVSMRLQWNVSALAAIPLRHEERGFQFSAQTGLGCIVADRWMTSLAAQQSRSIQKDDSSVTRSDYWATQISAAAYYFVADHVTLNVSAAQAWRKSRSDFYTLFPGASFVTNGGSVDFGLTYRFAGFTRIEGLFPATLN